MTRVDKRAAHFTRYVGRGSAFGNPFTHRLLDGTKALVQTDTVESAVGCFESWARGNTAWDALVPPRLRAKLLEALDTLNDGDVLGCYCAAGSPCHADVVIKLWKERHGRA